MLTTLQGILILSIYRTFTVRKQHYNEGLLWALACLTPCACVSARNGGGEAEDDASHPRVEVRAVLIRCDQKVPQGQGEAASAPDSISHFEREELYRHSAVRDCRKKIILTLRLLADSSNNGAEYITVERAYDPHSHDNVLLLNPYVLKLLQEPILQAYNLTYLTTIGDYQGSLINEELESKKNFNYMPKIVRRRRGALDAFTMEHRDPRHRSFSVKVDQQEEGGAPPQGDTSASTDHNPRDCGLSVYDDTVEQRTRSTSIHTPPEETHQHTNATSHHHRFHHHMLKNGEKSIRELTAPVGVTEWAVHGEEPLAAIERFQPDGIAELKEKPPSDVLRIKRQHPKSLTPHPAANVSLAAKLAQLARKTTVKWKDNFKLGLSKSETKCTKPGKQGKTVLGKGVERVRVAYHVYDIGTPALWFSVSIELFEKMSTTDGVTAWADATGGAPISIGSLQPEVAENSSLGATLSVRYRPGDCLQPEQYRLPAPNTLLLLVPQPAAAAAHGRGAAGRNTDDDGNDFLIVPASVFANAKASLKEPQSKPGWIWSLSNQDTTEEPWLYDRKQMEFEARLLRAARPLRSVCSAGAGRAAGAGVEHALVRRAGDSYLALRHRSPHHAQVDLEACADTNEMLRRDSTARVSTLVVDSSREKRSLVTVHVANTGLVSTTFRAVLSDCPPSMSGLMSAAVLPPPLLLPPRHTRQLLIELNGPLPVDTAQCAVGIRNDKDELAAIRSFTIKKRDRCFCVWHCKCACLGRSPHLACEPLPAELLAAAGFLEGDAPRRARAACYSDNPNLDALLLLVGLISVLIALGVLKGLLGAFYPRVSAWGLERLVELPRPLDRYHEPWLRDRPVLRDCAGWPVHPDTMQRTVRLMSIPAELGLNSVFFLTFPCAVLWTLLWLVTVCVCPCRAAAPHTPPAPCYAWTQRAELDTTRLIPPSGGGGGGYDGAGPDDTAEDSDTNYVLTQMQKSKQSLARSQKNRGATLGVSSAQESHRARPAPPPR